MNSQTNTNPKDRKLVHFLLWVSITLFYCYQYILRTIPNIIMKDIMSSYSVGAGEFGAFAGIYYIGYIAVHIPVGIMITRFGVKMIVPIFIILTAIGSAPLVYSDNWKMVIIGRLITGIGASAAAVGAIQIFRAIYPKNFAMVLGITVLCGLITAVYVTAPLAAVIESFGFDNTINALLILGFALSIVAYVLMPAIESEAQKGGILSDLKNVIMNPVLIITSIAGGLMVGPMEGFADAWGSAFIVSAYKLDKATADYLSLSIYTGMAIGCVVLPYIAAKLKSELVVTIISGIFMVACFLKLVSAELSADTLYYTCLAIGIFSAYQVIIIPQIANFVSVERSSLAASVANMFIMGFGWFFHNSIGAVLEEKWSGDLTDEGLKCYSPESFATAVSIIPTAGIIAVVILCIVFIYIKFKNKLNQKT